MAELGFLIGQILGWILIIAILVRIVLGIINK